MAKGGDIIEMGQALRVARRRHPRRAAGGHRAAPVPGPVDRGVALGGRVRARADRGGGDRAGGELRQPGLHFPPRFRLDWRPGPVVGITIPLVLAITFVTMYYWGVGLHKISLGSLIIALGLLVDDAIIAVEMMVQSSRRATTSCAATFAYEATAMPMLTGTLITAVGFPAHRHGQVDGGRIHLRDLRRHRGGAADLLVRVGLLRALPRHAAAADQAAWRGRRAARAVRHAVLHALPRAGELVREAPLDHHRPDVATLVLGVVGMGRVQNQFFPIRAGSRSSSTSGCPEGTSFAANEESPSASEARLTRAGGVAHVTTWVGSGAALRAGDRPDLPAEQRQPDDRDARDLAARERLRRNCPNCWPASSRGARARSCCQRAAGALPGAVPRRRAGSGAGARLTPTRSRPSCAPTRTCAA